jgi:apolipoprotein N-acyltransferase
MNLITFLLGALTSPAFLPADLVNGYVSFAASLLPILTFAVLCYLWVNVDAALVEHHFQTVTRRKGFKIGFFFGLGLFSAGIHWIIIALTGFGGMPLVIAAPLLILFIAFLALFPGAVGYLAVRFFKPQARWVALPALWGAVELFRGWLFGGFPWLSLGTSQAMPSPLAGFTPIGGVYLTSVVCLVVSALLAYFVRQKQLREKIAKKNIALLLVLLLVGGFSALVGFSRPQGEPLPVTLVQGDIPQDIKFNPAFLDETYSRYLNLVEKAQGKLILLPESAFPDFLDDVPEYQLQAFYREAKKRDGDILIGVFTREPSTVLPHDAYFNSVFSLGVSPTQVYRKRHLVLFGEKIPFEETVAPLMNAIISIPIAGQSEGDADQPPFNVAGQRVAISICFEDVFGSEQIARVRESTLLANFTNDAWYAHSIAAWQHHRIASLRALESERPMLRVTNTGITAVINHKGLTDRRIPWFRQQNLDTTVVGRTGPTPYLLWGDTFVLGVIVLMLIGAGVVSRRARDE